MHDPVKGRILGVADREINIKTTWDPAVYNIGPNADVKIPWGIEHVGEVWWNLSAVKWTWYEQGDQEYKTNNWGKLFPGSSIDIYEWTESRLLPSQWNTLLTTAEGNTLGLSGTPLHADDSQYTVIQKYNSRLDTLVDYYYYWVKNKATMPTNSVVERKNTTAYVANVIANPEKSGLKYYSVTSPNSLILNNIRNLSQDDIVLNVDIRTNTFDGDSHAVWKLAKEGDKDYIVRASLSPNIDLERHKQVFLDFVKQI